MIFGMSFKHLSVLLIITSLLLSGCALVYKPDIKQGNILNPEKIREIKPGMDQGQVIQLMGNPVLVNLFNDNQMVYVYTISPGHGQFKAQQLRIYFSNGQVTHYLVTYAQGELAGG